MTSKYRMNRFKLQLWVWHRGGGGGSQSALPSLQHRLTEHSRSHVVEVSSWSWSKEKLRHVLLEQELEEQASGMKGRSFTTWYEPLVLTKQWIASMVKARFPKVCPEICGKYRKRRDAGVRSVQQIQVIDVENTISCLGVDSLVGLHFRVGVQERAAAWGGVELHEERHLIRGVRCGGNRWPCDHFCLW